MPRLAPAWLILAAVLLACGPRTTQDTGEWSQRQLVIHDPPDGSGMLLGISLVRAGEERVPLPFDTADYARWHLDGEVLLTTDAEGSWWGWSEADQEPWLLRSAGPGVNASAVSIADDDRYLFIGESSAYDTENYSVTILDVQERGRIGRHLDCMLQSSFHWLDQGPDLVGVTSECEPFGPPIAHAAFHVRPGRSPETLITHPELPPKLLSVSPAGAPQRALLEHDGRWLLVQLYPDRDYEVLLDEPLTAERTAPSWSADGEHIAYRDGDTLVVREPSGAMRWQASLPGATAVQWSPIDDRFVTRVPCDGGSSTQLHVIDPVRDEHDTRSGCEPYVTSSWTSDASALVVGIACDAMEEEEEEEALDWVDPSTGERRRVGGCGLRSTQWSPEGSKLALRETCGPDTHRMRFLDLDGRELGRSPCADQAFGGWSPDGDMISISAGDPPRAQLMRLDGSVLDLGPGRPGPWRPGPLRSAPVQR